MSGKDVCVFVGVYFVSLTLCMCALLHASRGKEEEMKNQQEKDEIKKRDKMMGAE